MLNWNDSELISVVMPAYNAALFIGESIESIIAQTYPKWELIIVDDDSRDNTREIIDEFINKDERIRYFHQANGKQGKARNTGIANANGELIAFLDADDKWENNFLELQLELIAKTNADMVYANIRFINELSAVTEREHILENLFLKGNIGIAALLKKNDVPLSTVLMKKSAFIQVGGFKENPAIQYAEDLDFWIRLLLKGYCFSANNKVLVNYRLHPDQSSRNSIKKYEQMFDIIRSVPEEQGLEREKKAAMITWLRRLLVTSKESDNKELLEKTEYLPTAFMRGTCRLLSYLFPPFLLRRFIYIMTFID